MRNKIHQVDTGLSFPGTEDSSLSRNNSVSIDFLSEKIIVK